VLSTPNQVVWALLTYTDWWQPNTASVYRIGRRRGSITSDGIRRGLVETLSEREELCRRMETLDDTSRRLLYLWYLRQLPAHEIARELKLGRRQCFRRRAAAVRAIVDAGDPELRGRVPA
jgi:hypothetical protein